jgi:hypothetical protein
MTPDKILGTFLPSLELVTEVNRARTVPRSSEQGLQGGLWPLTSIDLWYRYGLVDLKLDFMPLILRRCLFF